MESFHYSAFASFSVSDIWSFLSALFPEVINRSFLLLTDRHPREGYAEPNLTLRKIVVCSIVSPEITLFSWAWYDKWRCADFVKAHNVSS